MLSPTILEILRHSDTPTVCNAIELAQGKRGFDQFTRAQVRAMHDNTNVAMGFARTAKIAAQQPAIAPPEQVKRIRMDYYRYMSQAPMPAICVIEDTDSSPVGAFWGEVNTNIHKGFGLSGTLTNGVMRDLGACPEDYQVIASGLSPSHRFVHVTQVGGTVNVFGLHIKEGDFIHADRHGACIIPLEILPEIDHWIDKMIGIEAIVLRATQQENFDFDLFQAAWQEIEKRRI